MEKTLYKVDVTLVCGDTVSFDDATTEGIGEAAYNQMGRDIRVIDGTKETFIPYHCVCKMEVTKTKTQVEYKDDICVEE